MDDNNENSVKEIMSIGNLPSRKPWDAVITLLWLSLYIEMGAIGAFPLKDAET